MDIYRVIKRPLTTEKGTKVKEYGKYLFAVDKRANKIEIKKAINKFFNVNVVSVRTINMHGKTRRVRLTSGKRSDWKKAYVTLKSGEKIEALEI